MSLETGAASPARGRSRGSRAGNALRLVVGVLVSVLFLWLALNQVRWGELVTASRSWRLAPIALSLLLQVIAFLLRLLRWGLATRHLGAVPWGRLAAIGSVGLSAVFLVPSRLGEIVRPLLVAEESDIPFGRASAPVVLERLADGWIMSGVLFATLLALGTQQESPILMTSGVLFAGLFAVASILLFFGTLRRQALSDLLRRTFGRVSARLADWVAGMALSLLTGLRHLAALRVLLPYAAISLLIWAAEAGAIYLLLEILQERQIALAALAVLSALVVGNTLPAGPAHLGVFEYAAVFSLGLFGVAQTEAAGFALLLHALNTGMVLAFGLAGLWVGGFRLRRVLRGRAPESTVEEAELDE